MDSVSVIVPVYNTSQFLRECLNSIIQELKMQDELIIINDGSTDDSMDICMEYTSDNVMVINNTNHGVSFSRNCGIQKASCKYVAFVDSDDYLFSGWRKKLSQGIETDKDIVFFSPDSSDVPCKTDLVKSNLFLPMGKKLSITAGACWSKLFKREYIVNHNISFDCDIINGEDGLFCLEAILQTDHISIIKTDSFYYYRPNAGSATHRYNERFNTSNLKYISTVKSLLEKHKCFLSEQINEYIDFIQVRGLYVLVNRIAAIEDKLERKKKYYLFEQPVYIDLYNQYTPVDYCPARIKRIFYLLKNKRYNSAIRQIRIIRLLSRFVHKMIGK